MAVLFLLLTLTVVSALKITGLTDEQYNSFPRLFHLDDYERCLSNQDGLYCIGTFTLGSSNENSPFELMKKYSEHVFNFNRTRLHRGYCVSERCPLDKNQLEQNATLRFERCVAKRARRHSLSARLRTAECTTHELHQSKAKLTPSLLQRLFIYVLLIILLLNVLGTISDVNSKPGDDKWRLLKCWSVPKNWRRVVDSIDMKDAQIKRMATLQGFRAIVVIIVLGVHVVIARSMLYTYQPHYLEELFRNIFGQVTSNSVSMLHTLVMISSFLTAYFIIKISEKTEVSIKALPLAIIKRVIRVSPTYLLMVGFAATWWHTLGDGPLWSSIVGENGSHCQKKFWAHALFVNNLIDNSDGYCLLPTWFLAADLHVNILVSAFTLFMARCGRKAVFVHATLFAVSCAVITTLSYYNEWKPLLYTCGPEIARIMGQNENGFHSVYLSSWILLPACFFGMFVAHLHVEWQKVGFKSSEHKYLKLYFNLGFPIFLVWLLSGIFLIEYTSPIVMALYVGFYRPVFCVIIGLAAIASFQFQEHLLSKVFAWKFWHALSRLSLPVLMIHWIILITMVGRTQYAVSTTLWDLVLDWIVLVVTSYGIAVPVTVLLEIPAQRFLEALMFTRKLKTC